jgi:hypothetical protein
MKRIPACGFNTLTMKEIPSQVYLNNCKQVLMENACLFEQLK